MNKQPKNEVFRDISNNITSWHPVLHLKLQVSRPEIVRVCTLSCISHLVSPMYYISKAWAPDKHLGRCLRLLFWDPHFHAMIQTCYSSNTTITARWEITKSTIFHE